MRTMPDSTREIVGFLCRWLLLAMVLATVAAGAVAGLQSATAVRDDLGTTMVLSDALWRQGGPDHPHLRGYIYPSLNAPALPMALANRPGGPMMKLVAHQNVVYLETDRLQTGPNLLILKGIPYSAVAFQKQRGTLLFAPADKELFLVDDRLLSRRTGTDPETIRRLLARLQTDGYVAFFHPGDLVQLEAMRREAQQLFPDVAVVFYETKTPDPLDTLRGVAWSWGAKGNGKPAVITADEELAGAAAAESFRVRLVGR